MKALQRRTARQTTFHEIIEELTAGIEAFRFFFRLCPRNLSKKLNPLTVAGGTSGTEAFAVKEVALVTCDELPWLNEDWLGRASRNCCPCARWGWRNVSL
jgi:hypothetical protein